MAHSFHTFPPPVPDQRNEPLSTHHGWQAGQSGDAQLLNLCVHTQQGGGSESPSRERLTLVLSVPFFPHLEYESVPEVAPHCSPSIHGKQFQGQRGAECLL